MFRILWGVGWANTYMPVLKALSDRIEGPRRSRAVSAHAGISGAGALLIAETIGCLARMALVIAFSSSIVYAL